MLASFLSEGACTLAASRDVQGRSEWQIVEGKFRKVVDGVVDYDWKGFD